MQSLLALIATITGWGGPPNALNPKPYDSVGFLTDAALCSALDSDHGIGGSLLTHSRKMNWRSSLGLTWHLGPLLRVNP